MDRHASLAMTKEQGVIELSNNTDNHYSTCYDKPMTHPFDQIKILLTPQGYKDIPGDMAPYLEAWRGGWKGVTPFIAFPSSTEQLSALVKLCAEARIPMVPQGGNTGLVGGAIPSLTGNELLINLSRMRKIRHIDPLNATLTAEAGCTLLEVQQAAQNAGMLFPLSMASEGSAQVGGFVSTNAGGTAVLRYGNTRQLVLGLEVVLPSGEIWQGLRGLRKDNMGYDLKQLFIGAEGTLGFVTAANVALFPQPKHRETMLFAIAHVDAALTLLHRFKEHTASAVTAFECISEAALSAVLKHIPGTRRPFAAEYPYYLLVECSVERAMLEPLLAEIFAAELVQDAVIAESLAQHQQFWHVRESISDALRQSGKGMHFDIALPISAIPAFIEATNAALMTRYPTLTIAPFGHIGDGNIHYNMVAPEVTPEMKQAVKAMVYDACIAHQGSISAEHGIGQERKAELYRYRSPLELQMMHSIKTAFDPHGLMNPGKVL